MNGAIEQLGELAEALVNEQREEEKRLAAVIEGKSLRVRRSEGVTWSPVSIEDQDFTFGGRVRLMVKMQHNAGLSGAFRTGSPVSIYQANESGAPQVPAEVRIGIVRKANAASLEIILDGTPLTAAETHERWTLDGRSDDRTFQRMARALSHWINTDDEGEQGIRNGLLDNGALPEVVKHELPQTSLTGPPSAINAQQQAWLTDALNEPVLSLLHGPPGTGKTTALLAYVVEMVHRKKRLLLTAPSNAAVDLLVAGCAERGISAVRMGHPMRLSDEVQRFGLDMLVEEDPEYKQVRDLRKRAKKAWQIVDRFHRNFGSEQRSERAAARHDAKSLQKEAFELERFIAERIIRQAYVVCATLSGSASEALATEKFDCVIIDESGQAMLPAALIAMRKSNRYILAGDPFQLPPVIKSDKARKMGLDESALARFMRSKSCAQRITLLTEQYRMHPDIMAPSSEWFYEGRLQAAPEMLLHALPDILRSPWTFIDSAGCGFDEEKEEGSASTFNAAEAEFVLQRTLEILQACPAFQVGVIAPYRAQVAELMRQFDALEVQAGMRERVEFATVDAFQGQERDAIVISLTRSNSEGEVGFLKEYRRTNVAMTRAKHHLLMIGDGATLGSDSFYHQLIERAEESRAYFSAWEWLYAS
jgi:ATP-dependent RNA/DNA helicase IGHMBP2